MLTHFLSSLKIKRFAIKNRNDTTYKHLFFFNLLEAEGTLFWSNVLSLLIVLNPSNVSVHPFSPFFSIANFFVFTAS